MQRYTPNDAIVNLMETYRKMVNDAIRVGLQKNVSSMKSLSIYCYREFMDRYDVISYYVLCAISRAAGILANRKKSIKRGFKTKSPYTLTPQLISCYGFKYIREMGVLKIPLGDKKFHDVMLNKHTMRILSDKDLRIRSFTLTAKNRISIAYAKDINDIECYDAVGLDRNVDNVTCGNKDNIILYNLEKASIIVERTKNIMSSFRRNDVRIRKKITSKYGRRRQNRVTQLLHAVSKDITLKSAKQRTAIVFEDIKGIRNLYQKGNWQGRKYRGRMNSWPFGEIKRQIEYKGRWLGIPIIHLTKGETKGTSIICSKCGERTRSYKDDKGRRTRKLYCPNCDILVGRDINAVINQSTRGLRRLRSSKGLTSEAMVLEPNNKELVIQVVDVSKKEVIEQCSYQSVCPRTDKASQF